MSTDMATNVLLLLLFAITGVFGKCPANERDGLTACEIRIGLPPPSCSSSQTSPHPILSIPHNQTLLNEATDVTVNITDYNSSHAPYTHLVCMSKPTLVLNFFPWLRYYYLNCTETNDSIITDLSVTWKTANNVSVYVFTSDSGGNDYGCSNQSLDIEYDKPLIVSLNLSQPNTTQDNLFQAGNIFVQVNTFREPAPDSLETTPQWSYDDTPTQDNEDYNSGGGPLDHIEYSYRFFWRNSSNSMETNNFTVNTSLPFKTEGNYSLLVEVVCKNVTNTTTEVYYGSNETHFEVNEPINETSLKFKDIPGDNVSIEVGATGSYPIKVSWLIVHSGNTSNATYPCGISNITLPKKGASSVTFNCTLTKPGEYNFNVTFSNKVSNKTMMYTYKIPSPSNKKAVVTTSTTVVVVVLLIVVVVIAIVLVSMYISYQKLRHKSTETANFEFIDLQRPSRLQQLHVHAMNVKDKFKRKRKKPKVGLVQPREGDSDLESFYGSLTHFPDHDSL